MKTLPLILSSLVLVLVACKNESGSDASSDASTPSSESAPSATASGAAADSGSDKAASTSSDKMADSMAKAKDVASGAAASMDAAVPADAAAARKEASGFGSTIDSTWNSIKGMDYSQKADFVNKAMGLVSKAKDHIATLSKLSNVLPEGMAGKLVSQVGGVSGNLSQLTSLLGNAGSLTSGDWSGFKDQIGKALGGASSPSWTRGPRRGPPG